jgi:uncharacterized membrane protein
MQKYLGAVLPRPVMPALPFATLFFIASLTPSLVPRDTAVQAMLSGISLAAGYGVGLVLVSVWYRLQLPTLRPDLRQRVNGVIGAACLMAAAATLWQASD